MKQHLPRALYAGFSLIELMVAMIVGMLVALAATSGASFFEANRRNTLGNSGALENGIAVSFNLQKEIQAAGLWTVNAPCKALHKYDSNSGTWGSETDLSMKNILGAPVTITGDANAATASDSITVISMRNMIGAPNTLTKDANGAELSLSTTDGFTKGDTILLAPPAGSTSTKCFLATVTEVQTSATKIQTRPSIKGTQTNTLPSDYSYPKNSQVFNLGSSVNQIYRVTNTFNDKDLNVFESVDLNQDSDSDPNRNGSTTVLAENVVMLRAQYGISTASSELGIAKWVNPDNASVSSNVLRAIRIAVVARSAQPNLKSKVNGTCTTTTSNPSLPWSTGDEDDTARALDIGLDSDETKKCYEYRVTTIVIPLKNYLFSGGGA